ncbi:hypothetical protein [Parapedobacter indicus]|uniref:hypothetical protein n=1 Tax=Parapedobacter indicus TaxID=1477437 RepID=UPI000B84B519|nr:hypothetical protein [Parapedobacter indicus]
MLLLESTVIPVFPLSGNKRSKARAPLKFLALIGTDWHESVPIGAISSTAVRLVFDNRSETLRESFDHCSTRLRQSFGYSSAASRTAAGTPC